MDYKTVKLMLVINYLNEVYYLLCFIFLLYPSRVATPLTKKLKETRYNNI